MARGQLLAGVLREAKELAKRVGEPSFVRELLPRLVSSTASVGLDDLGLPSNVAARVNEVGRLGFLNVFEDRDGVFMVPKGRRLPLHDHPRMHVATVILWGGCSVTSMDWEPRTRGVARVTRDLSLVAGDSTSLSPADGSLHEIVAHPSQGCGFLDVIVPPYDHIERRCTYYRAQPVGGDDEEEVLLHEHYPAAELDFITFRLNGLPLGPEDVR